MGNKAICPYPEREKNAHRNVEWRVPLPEWVLPYDWSEVSPTGTSDPREGKPGNSPVSWTWLSASIHGTEVFSERMGCQRATTEESIANRSSRLCPWNCTELPEDWRLEGIVRTRTMWGWWPWNYWGAGIYSLTGLFFSPFIFLIIVSVSLAFSPWLFHFDDCLTKSMDCTQPWGQRATRQWAHWSLNIPTTAHEPWGGGSGWTGKVGGGGGTEWTVFFGISLFSAFFCGTLNWGTSCSGANTCQRSKGSGSFFLKYVSTWSKQP